MTVDGGQAGIAHHADDGHQVARGLPTLRGFGRAGVPEVEEVRFLAFQRVPEDFANTAALAPL